MVTAYSVRGHFVVQTVGKESEWIKGSRVNVIRWCITHAKPVGQTLGLVTKGHAKASPMGAEHMKDNCARSAANMR